ncbi:MAG: YeeE/YedE family protein [Aestuariivita sp.]|nr:YeeE/YedE family protein [Aestuariivita sp.]MCY4346275.1 YeeE/YedE family protein [Aestuariivita sp.]
MLLELLEYDGDVSRLLLLVGVILGLVFGAAAQISRFCLRQAVAGEPENRRSAIAIWLSALATGLIGAAFAQNAGLISLTDHRFTASTIPIIAILTGGALFGAGMIMTRGCVSRLTVLAGTGNTRAMLVLLVFAITAHAVMKGVLVPVRTSLGSLTIDLPFARIGDLPLVFSIVVAIIVIALLALTRAVQARPSHLVLGAVIGLVAVTSWMVTSTLLFDEFDPQPVQAIAFTLPWADSLFWVLASTAIPAGFGVGFVGGVLLGSLLSALVRKEWELKGFTSGKQTVQYLVGGILMGIGGPLAGGCTIGAGLAGVSTGSIAALLALIAIAGSGWLTAQILTRRSSLVLATA